MASRNAPSALVVGDGIAGQGAALVLARAGWQVCLALPRPGKPAAHRRHAHLTSAAVIAQFERAIGTSLSGGWAMGATAVWDENGRRDESPRPIIGAEALRLSLAAQAAAAGAQSLRDCTITPLANGAGWRWRARGTSGHADVVVDATGGGHWLSRVVGTAVTIEEIAGTDRAWSWTGINDGPPLPWLLAARGCTQAAVLLREPDGQVRLTLRAAQAAAPDPLAALDRLLIGAGAAWAARIGSLALDPRPLRHEAPLARRTLVGPDPALPALLRLGDGLIQTAPRLGQGIAQIAEQLEALAGALAAALPPGQWQARLDALAERRWAGLMLGTGLMLGAGLVRIAA